MNTIFQYECKRWLKSKAVWIIFLTWCGISTFAIRDRDQAIRSVQAAYNTNRVYEDSLEKIYYLNLDSVENGLKQVPNWRADPRNPVVFNLRVPRFAFFQVGPLNPLVTGQSDILPGKFVASRRFDYRVERQNASNGLQTFYGRLDMAFAIVLLLPLLIVGLNFNILSSEKEKNTLKLLLAQEASVIGIITGKLAVSFLFTFILLLIPLFFAGIGMSNAIWVYLAVGSLYSLFWHLLCGYVNSRLKSSAWNATVLLSSWMFFILILPALINTVTEMLHPVPSRTKFITEYRRILNQADKDSTSAVLNKYFYDHPEMVKQDTAGNIRNRANEFYKASHINQDKTQRALWPLHEANNRAILSANKFADNAGLISPSAIMHQSLILLAGQSTRQYLYFHQQIDKWRKPYLDFVLNKLVQDGAVTKAETEQFKGFRYTPYDFSRQLVINCLALLLFNVLLGVLLFRSCKRVIVV